MLSSASSRLPYAMNVAFERSAPDSVCLAIENLRHKQCILSAVPALQDPHVVIFSSNLLDTEANPTGLACLIYIPEKATTGLSITYNKQHQWLIESFVLRNINIRSAFRWHIAEQSPQNISFFYNCEDEAVHSSAVRAECLRTVQNVRRMDSCMTFNMKFPSVSFKEIDETVYLVELITSYKDSTLTVRISTQYATTTFSFKIEVHEIDSMYQSDFVHQTVDSFKDFKSWLNLNRRLSKNNEQVLYIGNRDTPFISCKTTTPHGCFVVSTLFTKTLSQKPQELQTLGVDTTSSFEPVELRPLKKPRQRA